MNREYDVQPSFRAEELPEIIQGGMGFGVSNYELAGAVARNHELGVVSGTGTGMLLARRLQDGHAESVEILEKFPDEDLAAKIIENYFIKGRLEPRKKYPKPDMLSCEEVDRAQEPGKKTTISYEIGRDAEELNLVGSFVEVALAKKRSGGHGKIGINLLQKLEEPTLTTLYGAMLADVDVVIMGAGIPRDIPRALDNLAQHSPATIALEVTGDDYRHKMVFDPEERYTKLMNQDLIRPNFLAIVSSNLLAKALLRNDNPPNGFVVEHHTAGGHNASPRNKKMFNEHGEPEYGLKDEVDFFELSNPKQEQQRLPFWVAGGFGGPESLSAAKELGAKGTQVGSIFALTRESGLDHDTKIKIVKDILNGKDIDIYTDPLASPTGFPFKVAQIGDTLSVSEVYDKRVRICDLGYLREKYEGEDGSIAYRCASEPVNIYKSKGGSEETTKGRKCLCNALAATINMPQFRGERRGYEPMIVTLGNDVNRVVRLMMARMHEANPKTGEPELYTAKEVLDYLRSGSE